MSMSAIGTPRIVNSFQALSLVLSLLVLIGWGALAYAKSSATAQREACERVGELKVSLGQVMAERDEAQAQLAAAQQEMAVLAKRLEDLQPKPRKRGASAP